VKGKLHNKNTRRGVRKYLNFSKKGFEKTIRLYIIAKNYFARAGVVRNCRFYRQGTQRKENRRTPEEDYR